MNLVLFGKPGTGKGTQATLLKETYQFIHLSTGELFRWNIDNDTELGNKAKAYMDEGNLVPDELTITMLVAEVNKHPQAEGFIFDGFPRTRAQAEALDSLLASKQMKIDAAIAIEVPEDMLVHRLLKRGEESGRTDDQSEEKIRTRFEEYNKKTSPLIAYYKEQGKFREVNGVGAVTEIAARLHAVINSL